MKEIKTFSYIKPNVPEQYTDFTLFKRPTQSGGELEKIRKDKKIISNLTKPSTKKTIKLNSNR